MHKVNSSSTQFPWGIRVEEGLIMQSGLTQTSFIQQSYDRLLTVVFTLPFKKLVLPQNIPQGLPQEEQTRVRNLGLPVPRGLCLLTTPDPLLVIVKLFLIQFQ